MPFENPPTSLLLSATGTETPPYIFLDGDTGEIIIVGSNGSVIKLSPNATFPIQEFISQDGTNNAFFNITGGADDADLGINSGVFTPADGVARRMRIFMNGSGASHILQMAIIRADNQVRRGGFVHLTPTTAEIGFSTDASGVAPSFRADGASDSLNINAATPQVQSQLICTDVGVAEKRQAATGNTSSGTFGDFPGPVTCTFRHRHGGARVMANISATCFTNVAGTEVEFAVELDDGVAVTVEIPAAGKFFNVINSHETSSGTGVLPGATFVGGSYTAKLLWRRRAGGGTIFVDGGDTISFFVQELAAQSV